METITSFFNKHGHTDKHTKHTYDVPYEKWFSSYRDKAFNFLEIGVTSYGGGDLLAFADYFPKATIYGLDHVMDKMLPEVLTHERIKLIEADAYSPKTADLLGDLKFDIIIDDCIHNHPCQSKVVQIYYPFLAKDGIYVIEDCPQVHLKLWEPIKVRKNMVYPVIFDLIHERPHRSTNTLIRIEANPPA